MRIRIWIILSFLLSNYWLQGQNCTCSITQVTSNSVESCDQVFGEIIVVSNTMELKNAINQANANGGNMTILLEDGTYAIASTNWYPYITGDSIVFRSESGNRDAVIWTGQGMQDVAPGVENGFYIVGDYITIADMTIRDVGNHAIATEGDHLFVHNVLIQNTFEQMIKGTSAGDGSDESIVQCSKFEYPNGIGPQFYIGGLDIHEGNNWLVRDNYFENIISPSGSAAEHAIHFWNNGADNIIERNWIVNCDRGIGFGLGSSPNEGGVIRNNMIYNEGVGDFHDVGIGMESSPNTKVYNNSIYIGYQNAIEYRFEETTNVDIRNNLTNKKIKSRDGGSGALSSNIENALSDWFQNIETGDLRLHESVAEAIDQGEDLGPMLTDDIDKSSRPQGAKTDIGAHEVLQSSGLKDAGLSGDLRIYPNPAYNWINLSHQHTKIRSIKILSMRSSKLCKQFAEMHAKEVNMYVGDLENGSYLLQIETDDFIVSYEKLVIIKL